MTYTLDHVRSLFGVLVILGIAWLFSAAKARVPWRIVAIGVGLEIAIAAAMFALPPLRAILAAASSAIDALLAATLEGARFVYGHLAGGPAPFAITDPNSQTVLAFGALQLIIVISALSAILWRWGVLGLACKGLGFVLRRTMGLNGPLALSTAANIFLGMVEAPLVIRPYLGRMSRSDLFVIMTTGLATIAGTVMAIYATFLKSTQPDAAGHILVASFMAAPGSIVIARMMQPQEAGEADLADQEAPKLYRSTMDAFAKGVADGVQLLIAVVAMLLAAVAIVALGNMILAAILPPVGGAEVTIGRILGWLFAPLMWLIGVPWHDALPAGELMGTKTALNEFLAYLDLGSRPAGFMEPRTRLMLVYGLCGFSNFASLAIMIGGLSALCPERRDDFADLGFRSLIAGTLTTLLGAALIGAVPIEWLRL
jgi:CNT family concentrative nucleoside transporter